MVQTNNQQSTAFDRQSFNTRYTTLSRELTERQQKFLDVLFEEAGGDVVQAKLLAGYSEKTSTASVVASMKDEIMDATTLYMSRNAPKAAVAMVSGVDDPTQLGIRDKLSASKELLDRVGLIKTEKVQVEASGGVMILPPKKDNG